jgi:hypothetical protein
MRRIGQCIHGVRHLDLKTAEQFTQHVGTHIGIDKVFFFSPNSNLFKLGRRIFGRAARLLGCLK